MYYYEKAYSSLIAKFLDLADSIKSNGYFVSNTEHRKVLSVNTSKICCKRRIYRDENEWLYL